MKTITKLFALCLLPFALASAAFAQSTAFTYQGRLNDTNGPASGVYDFQFALQSSAGAQVGSTVSSSGVAVSNGLFTVSLDFGNQFPGAARLLEIAVRTNGFTSFTTLAPRQPLTPTPYAITASNLSGTLPLAQLPAVVVTNGAGGVNLTGTFTGNGAGVTNVNAEKLGGLTVGNFWQLNGNNVTNGQFLGSTNNQPLELRVNNQRGLRLETGGSNSVNVIGGYAGNYIAPGVAGAIIGGGGAGSYGGVAYSNQIGGGAVFSTVGGGVNNAIQTNSHSSTIGGGGGNTIQMDSYASTIGGGYINTIQPNSYDSTIGGGGGNAIQPNSYFSTIGGGNGNAIQPNSYFSTIGGGSGNAIETNSYDSTIGGGIGNAIRPNSHDSTIGGGSGNAIQPNSDGSTIGGGGNNNIQPNSGFSIIGGGGGNIIQPASGYATIGGGYQNNIQTNSPDSTIGGGGNNTIQPNSVYSTIGGGGVNTIQMDSPDSTIGGGYANTIQTNSLDSTIGGGYLNTIQANSERSTIGGGYLNTIQPDSFFSAIPGGVNNTAGSYAFAAGNRAKAVSLGAFVWADSQDADFSSTADNQFLVRAAGGVGINTTNPAVSLTVQGSGLYNAIGAAAIAVKNSTSGKTWEWHVLDDGKMQFADLGAGATRMLIDTAGNVSANSFITTSDRNAKENFAAVSAQEILAKVAALPITRWNFKGDTATPHVGPMAQDFRAAFGLGPDEKHIATVDADGVAFAAIQGLNQKLEEQKAENAELKQRLEKLEQLVNEKSKE